MARYTSTYRRRRNRKRIYIILTLSVVALILVVVYKPLDKGTKQSDSAAPDNAGLDLDQPQVSIEPEPELPKMVPEIVGEPNSQATELITEAMELINSKPPRIIEARDMLNELLPMSMSSRQRAFVKERLTQLAEEWLFSKTVFPKDSLCSSYRVKPGNLLTSIGRQHKVPYEIIMEVNKISRPQALQASETIKVINGPFHARIYRSTFTMDLYLQNTFVRSFSVGLGREGRETPTGFWVVEPGGKLIKPTWTDPDTGKTYEAEDPDYPLGSRWIRLKGIKGEAVGRTGIAFHGTKDPNLIGSAGSRGCIRLHNGDVIFVYNVLEPGHSRVEVVD